MPYLLLFSFCFFVFFCIICSVKHFVCFCHAMWQNEKLINKLILQLFLTFTMPKVFYCSLLAKKKGGTRNLCKFIQIEAKELKQKSN